MTDIDYFNRLIADGVPASTALDVLLGKTTEAAAVEDARRRRAATAILALRARDRPRPPLVWDLSSAYWHRSLDNCDAAAFAAAYSDVAVFSVCRRELVEALSPYARRKSGPWSKLYRSKTAGLVAHLQAGGEVTPPLVIEGRDGLALAGGYHRLGWAHYCKIVRMPVLLSRTIEPLVVHRLPSLINDGGAAAVAV